jgi:hypothetical protein
LGPVQPQELTMETTDSSDKQIFGANGIPWGCMSFPRGPLLHLLRQAWNQIDCSWTSLNSLDGFLSNVAMLTLKSMQKEINILHTYLSIWKHLCLMMVTKPRVKGADNTHNVTAQKRVITRHFHNMAQN